MAAISSGSFWQRGRKRYRRPEISDRFDSGDLLRSSPPAGRLRSLRFPPQPFDDEIPVEFGEERSQLWALVLVEEESIAGAEEIA